ncbi:NAD(P)/FAD-dependent oxidoreductase [Neorhodopirellula pilleata]|uniref:NAD(P)/FAD-dependent oxidoreductase n=1 Tax=Neorhodopirellula pilleata TaxID=2714738 RepID=UPI001E566E81|nr:FAD-dependent oxidoreductase [Neorhodopirellula pilleata]
MNIKKKVNIVGGGVIGLSVAWELSRRGHAVTLIERNADQSIAPVEQPTSWTAGGILPPANFELATDPMERFRGFSHQLWPQWAEQLHQQSEIDPGFVRCGGYYLAETAGEAAAMIGMVSYWDEMGIVCEAVSPDNLRTKQPWLGSWADQNPWIQEHPDAAAWWVPDEYQVRPPRLLQALVAACQKNGVQFRHGDSVSHLSDVTRESEDEPIIVCGGTWAGLVDVDLNLENALIPIRGQILLLRCESMNNPIVVNLGNRYLIARGDGHVLVGSCEEEVGFDRSTTDDEIDTLRQFAGRLNPELTDAPEIQRWAGLRPMTFDGFPMIGRVPNRHSVFVAAGHYRSGIHFAPATAVAIADGIENQPTFMDMTPFSVGRQQAHAQ